MRVVHSKNRRRQFPDADIAQILRQVTTTNLRRFVELLSFPRHYVAEKKANIRARNLLLQELSRFGYLPTLQGEFDNIVVTSTDTADQPLLLLGAHYDSVPKTPGADDNASAVAVCLECARLIREHNLASVAIVFFNREEDGLLGSRDFVAELQRDTPYLIDEAHIFEMVGYCSHELGSQRLPPGLPGITAPNVGDFLALLANRKSNQIAESLLVLAAQYSPEFPVLALKMYLGAERYFADLNRSDHAPFWEAGIPALMWTDTSEFRNSHYHSEFDTPDTLDYDFMAQITRLALARVLTKQ